MSCRGSVGVSWRIDVRWTVVGRGQMEILDGFDSSFTDTFVYSI